MAEEKGDHLCLAGNHSVQKMLNKHGKNTPLPEIVKFSDFVVKINKKGKEQTRVMLITNKAMYNLMPNNYGKCKRRISIEEVLPVEFQMNLFCMSLLSMIIVSRAQKKKQFAKLCKNYLKSTCKNMTRVRKRS
jgi:hypothetical protein